MGPICDDTAIRHWIKNAVNGKMRENKLNPSYLVLQAQAAEINRIPSVSKIITLNIPIGKEYSRKDNKSHGIGHTNRVFRNIALILTGQLDECLLSSDHREEYKLDKTEINYDSEFAQLLNLDDAKKLIIKFFIEYFQKVYYQDLENKFVGI